ncbi:hypothetical protein FA13DRAFT_1743190 [Coprinellus micaceus]|uniref:Uncharacterized protein n=1 Tax=Coprinellus micaceus TaxID=71717 RepID=A0A4Y7SEJ5_COPMI|nr:hypothetical protein FA13DRAFT_1743190 [Coprinellus micaceus]
MIPTPPWELGVWGPGFCVGPLQSLAISVHRGHRPSLARPTRLHEIHMNIYSKTIYKSN